MCLVNLHIGQSLPTIQRERNESSTIFTKRLRTAVKMSNVDLMHKIAALQLFDGSYNLDSSLCASLGINVTTSTQMASRNGWPPKAFAVTLVLALFRDKLGSLQDDWELVADKSRIWLLSNAAQYADAMFDNAVKMISNK